MADIECLAPFVDDATTVDWDTDIWGFLNSGTITPGLRPSAADDVYFRGQIPQVNLSGTATVNKLISDDPVMNAVDWELKITATGDLTVLNGTEHLSGTLAKISGTGSTLSITNGNGFGWQITTAGHLTLTDTAINESYLRVVVFKSLTINGTCTAKRIDWQSTTGGTTVNGDFRKADGGRVAYIVFKNPSKPIPLLSGNGTGGISFSTYTSGAIAYLDAPNFSEIAIAMNGSTIVELSPAMQATNATGAMQIVALGTQAAGQTFVFTHDWYLDAPVVNNYGGTQDWSTNNVEPIRRDGNAMFLAFRGDGVTIPSPLKPWRLSRLSTNHSPGGTFQGSLNVATGDTLTILLTAAGANLRVDELTVEAGGTLRLMDLEVDTFSSQGTVIRNTGDPATLKTTNASLTGGTITDFAWNAASEVVATNTSIDRIDASAGRQIDASAPSNINVQGDTNPGDGLSLTSPNVQFQFTSPSTSSFWANSNHC